MHDLGSGRTSEKKDRVLKKNHLKNGNRLEESAHKNVNVRRVFTLLKILVEEEEPPYKDSQLHFLGSVDTL